MSNIWIKLGQNGAMFVGNPAQVVEKLIRMIEDLGLDRFMLHLPLGSMPHDQVLRAIELFGTQVAPKVRAYFAMKRGLIKILIRLIRKINIKTQSPEH